MFVAIGKMRSTSLTRTGNPASSSASIRPFHVGFSPHRRHWSRSSVVHFFGSLGCRAAIIPIVLLILGISSPFLARFCQPSGWAATESTMESFFLCPYSSYLSRLRFRTDGLWSEWCVKWFNIEWVPRKHDCVSNTIMLRLQEYWFYKYTQVWVTENLAFCSVCLANC